MSVYGTLSDDREEQYRSLRKKILDELGTRQEETDQQVKEEIFWSVADAAETYGFTARDRAEMGKRLYNSLRGLDILQPLLDDPEVTDIMVNGPEHVYVEKADHTGIVVRVEGGTIYTVEGNCSDSCKEKRYSVGHYEILGYGVPAY